MRVALATCQVLPEADSDGPLLLEALRARGIEASMVAWDGGAPPEADLVVLRSTWNYHLRVEAFFDWIDAASARATVLNPPDVVRWNADKHYLADLAARGIPTVPTRYVPRGEPGSMRGILDETGWSRAVLKPSRSAASYRTMRVGPDDVPDAQRLLDQITRDCDAMVQPYVDAVEGSGERAVVWIAGAVTHSVRKAPRFGTDPERVSDALPVARDQTALAERALAPWRDRLLYARVDMVRGPDDQLMVMELELIEPSLFLNRNRPAMERLADAIASR